MVWWSSNPGEATKYWILGALGTVLLLGALLFDTVSLQRLLEERSRRYLAAETHRQALRLVRWQNDLTAALITLAEQKGIRDGVMRMAAGQASADFRTGWLSSADAVCRLFPARFPGVEGLTLRSPDGSKWAGTGVQQDSGSVAYPDYHVLYRRLRVENNPHRVVERWVVPVRDVQAQPLAFLVAEVNPAGLRKLFPDLDSTSTSLVCLDDSSGARLWDSQAKLQIPRMAATATEFILADREYQLAREAVPGSGWAVCQARSRNLIEAELSRWRRHSAVIAGGGIVLLALATFILKPKRKSNQ